jgi:benzoate-CoA ligase
MEEILKTIPRVDNAAEYFIDKHIAEHREQKIAIECGDVRVTYGELYRKVNQFGNSLGVLGLSRAERVILLLPDIPEFAISFFGAIKAGVIPVPINTSLSPSEYDYILEHAQPSLIVTVPALFSRLPEKYQKDGAGKPRILMVGAMSPQTLSFEEVLRENPDEFDGVVNNEDDPAFWLYSSGSTGPPKACVHRGRDMIVCSERYAKGILRMTAEDRCFSVSKLFFAYGLGNALYYPFAVGATSILFSDAPKPEAIFEVIHRYHPTIFFSVPTSYNSLLHHADGRNRADLASIRIAVSAGEILPGTIFHQYKERFGLEILDSIGSTEMTQAFISNSPGAARPGSAGRLIPGYEARIVDERGDPVATGEVGDLIVRGDSLCSGYWNDPERTRRAFVDGWFKTGDTCYEDKDGFFWFLGRSDDMIKSNGMWVSPVEVENCLIDHPAIREAAVVGSADETGLVKPVAYIGLRDSVILDEALEQNIKTFIASKLASYKCPRKIIATPELPRTATGKIQRFKLRAK